MDSREPVDFSDLTEGEVVARGDSLLSVTKKLERLHTTTRMAVLATTYPHAYGKLKEVHESMKRLFES